MYLAATLTLGFQRFSSVVQAGPRLWLHRLGQGLSGIAYLSNKGGFLCLSQDHRALDGSEKTGMSYWQGMVFAKLAVAEVLRIRWLQHADAMESLGRLDRNTGQGKNSRADMVGQDDNKRWHVVEAKGFSRTLPPGAIQNAKDQAGIVGTIDNEPPTTTSASIACLWKSPIEIVLDDPPPIKNEKWHLNRDDYWSSYYGGIANYIRSAKNPQSHPDLPGFSFASLSPLLGIVPKSRRSTQWEMPMVGLPDVLLRNVSMAPKILPDLMNSSSNHFDRVLQDGVALVGTVDDFQKGYD